MEKPLILVVETDPEKVSLLQQVLKKNYTLLRIGHADALFEQAARKRPDLVLINLQLAGIDGYNLTRRLRKRPYTAMVPVILLSAQADVDIKLKRFKAGAADIITLPFHPRELKARIDTQISLRKTREDLEAANRELRRSRKRIEMIFQQVPVGIITVDINGVVQQCNKQMSELCPEQMPIPTGMPISELNSRCEDGCWNILRQALETGETIHEQYIRCQNKLTRTSHLVLNSHQFHNDNGEIEGTMLVVRDVSHIKAMENKVRDAFSHGNLIGKNERIQEVYKLARRLADLDTTVLLTGESGTGKELAMEAIHFGGQRAEKPLVRLNCAALPESIIESEIFGHVRGAYTGAISDRTGRIEAADGGTLFLDEIGDIPPHIQLKLLRFLEKHEFERVGDNRVHQADVRIIAATNQNLEKQVRVGLFREDFYYRLKIIRIHMPPLRERKDDIPVLVAHFLDLFSAQLNRFFEGLSDDVMTLFMDYDWPGNVRELKHAMEHAAIVCPGGRINTAHLPEEIGSPLRKQTSVKPKRTSHTPDRKTIDTAIASCEGNKARAARMLGIHRSTLYRKLTEFSQ